MRILATGPESSGTNAMTRLLEAGGAEAVHRSQPEGPDWIDMEAMLEEFDHIVIVIRGLSGHLASLQRREIALSDGGAHAKRRKALSRLAPIMGHPHVTVVTYESMCELEERYALLSGLRLDPEGAYAEDWINENRKYHES